MASELMIIYLYDNISNTKTRTIMNNEENILSRNLSRITIQHGNGGHRKWFGFCKRIIF